MKLKKKKKIGTIDDINININPREQAPCKEYRIFKCSLKKLILGKKATQILSGVIYRSNDVLTHVYMFIKLFVLHKYHSNSPLPILDTDFIKLVFRVLSTTSGSGAKITGQKKLLLDELIDFYNKHYKRLGYVKEINGVGLSHVFDELAITVATNIKNNIIMHFDKYVKKYVKTSHYAKNVDDQLYKTRKEFNRDMYFITNDLINMNPINALKSKPEYHQWINDNRHMILPNRNPVISLEQDIKNNPFAYLKHMIYICISLEKLNVKSFQILPLKSSCIPGYVPLSTAILIDIIPESYVKRLGKKVTKTSLSNDITNNNRRIWGLIFNMKRKIFKSRKYQFDYRVLTDGYSISLQFIHKTIAQSNLKGKLARTQAGAIEKRKTKDMNVQQKDEYKRNKKQFDQEKKRNESLIRAQKRREETEKFKALPKAERDKIIANRKKEKNESIYKKYIKHPYLETLNDYEYKALQAAPTWVVCDPGKRDLLYMRSNTGDTFVYSNDEHMSKTKRKKYQQLLSNYMSKTGITKAESLLKNVNSKTCIFYKFEEYIRIKIKTNCKVDKNYKAEIFRKYRWYGYINRKRAYDNLVNSVKNRFGKDTPIIYGDWSQKKQMKNFISTPNDTIKNKLGESMTVYTINEFRTSCLHHETEIRCKNLMYLDKKGKQRKLHPVLESTMLSGRKGYINRDNNSVRNMVKIVKSYLKDKTRPSIYTESVSANKIKKKSLETEASIMRNPKKSNFINRKRERLASNMRNKKFEGINALRLGERSDTVSDIFKVIIM